MVPDSESSPGKTEEFSLFAGGRLYQLLLRVGLVNVAGIDRKWICGQRSPDEFLMGTNDIQSLADLANSFAVVRSITPFLRIVL